MTTRRDASFRHSHYYANVLLQADRLYEKGARDIENGLHLFDMNWRNIELGQMWATQWRDRDQEAATLSSEYPERGARCLYLRQKPNERLEWLGAALSVVHSRGMELVEGTLHGKMGLALSEMGEYQKAIEHYSIRLEIAMRLKDNEGLGEGLCNLGILYDNLNLVQQARECYEQALELANSISNQKILEVSLGNLGLLYLEEEKYGKAREYFEHHLELAMKNGDLWSQGNALTNSGIASLKLHNYSQAIECFQESLLINKRLGDLEGEAKNLSYIGMTSTALNDLGEAAAAYRERIAIACKLHDDQGEAIGYWNLGELLIKQEKYREGITCMKKCIDYEERVADPNLQKDLEIFHAIQQRYGVETGS